MANTVLLKRSNTPGSVPAASNLTAGELAINYADGKLYFLGSSGTVTQIAGNSSMTYSGNVTAGNFLTSGSISATSNITGGNISAAGQITASGNITVGNVVTSGIVSAGGNVLAGNVTTTGNLYVGTGNAGYIYGNAFYMTGISSAISVTKIENGNSNVWVRTPGGDVTVTAGGVANVALFSTGSMTLSGAFATPKTITSNVDVANNVNGMFLGPLKFEDNAFLTVPDSSTVYIYSPN